MLRKALTTTVLAIGLLTNSISANEVNTDTISTTTAKVETIGAFKNIPNTDLNSEELKLAGEWYVSLFWGAIKFGSADK